MACGVVAHSPLSGYAVVIPGIPAVVIRCRECAKGLLVLLNERELLTEGTSKNSIRGYFELIEVPLSLSPNTHLSVTVRRSKPTKRSSASRIEVALD